MAQVQVNENHEHQTPVSRGVFGFTEQMKTFYWGHCTAKVCKDYGLVSTHRYSSATEIDTLWCTVLQKKIPVGFSCATVSQGYQIFFFVVDVARWWRWNMRCISAAFVNCFDSCPFVLYVCARFALYLGWGHKWNRDLVICLWVSDFWRWRSERKKSWSGSLPPQQHASVFVNKTDWILFGNLPAS